MTHPQNRPVAISLRLYRALARAFPYEFKNAYGNELVQVAEDTIEPIWQRHGVLGLVRLLADIALRVALEHLAELRQDVRYGLRMLAHSPGFALVALVSLSLGIAIATCAYSEVNGLILRDLPGVRSPRNWLRSRRQRRTRTTSATANEATCSLPRWPMLRLFLSGFHSTVTQNELGDTWSRRRTSPLWACAPYWAASLSKNRSSPAGRQSSWSATGSGSNIWVLTLRLWEGRCASTDNLAP
jgi:hypothetical protein